MVSWSFLSSHTPGLLCIARDPGARLRDIAASVGVTGRSAHAIVTDLAGAGYDIRQKDGRRNRHDERGLKHRPASEARRVPIPPELVAIPRQHIDTFDIAADGRIFSSDREHPVASTVIGDVWASARNLALTPAQAASSWPGASTTCGTRLYRRG